MMAPTCRSQTLLFMIQTRVEPICRPDNRHITSPIGHTPLRQAGVRRRSIGLSVGRSVGRSVGQSADGPVGRSVDRPVGRSVDRTDCRFFGRSVGRLVCRSVGRLVCRSIMKRSFVLRHGCQSVSAVSVMNQSVSTVEFNTSTVFGSSESLEVFQVVPRPSAIPTISPPPSPFTPSTRQLHP